jgi:hypothetical protein
MAYLAAVNGLHIDMIRTLLGAESAIGAGIVVFSYMENLEFRL